MANDKVNFADSSGIAQALKYQVRAGKFWNDLTPAAKESLDQISTAIARMVAGDGAHWDAIIGYAHAAKPDEPTVVATVELERGIRDFVRGMPSRNDHG